MLAQVREITGIDGTTLQNWLKRGWVASPAKKAYSKEHLARILIINMLRDTMQLSQIIFLLTYVNGNDPRDSIIPESLLYDYICKVLEAWCRNGAGSDLRVIIADITYDYNERFSGARRRLERALEIIVRAYQATLIKRFTDTLFEEIEK
jgi:DNA-binding transcriptional MerR regulator